jgi:3-hydroxyisobutyrate dehydrogenase-like beta-hydroxyacid dehydrogenase
MNDRIGFIGLGSMGQPMAGNLLDAGYELHAYNRTASKAEPLVARGAKQAAHPGDVAEPGGIVITMVANDHALEEIVLGEAGILERLAPGGIHVSMSTVAPATAARLAERHAQSGSTYLAAPVFGRPEAAAARQLWVCVSGPPAAKERVQPILGALGQGTFDFGEESGAANVVKLAGNFLIVSAMEAMAEALTLAEKNGISRSAVIDMLGQTLFAAPVYRNYGRAIAEKRHTPAGFQLSLGLKDVNLVLQTAAEASMPMPVASLLHDRLLASVAKGRGAMDWSALSLGVLEDAGLEVADPGPQGPGHGRDAA